MTDVLNENIQIEDRRDGMLSCNHVTFFLKHDMTDVLNENIQIEDRRDGMLSCNHVTFFF